MDSLASGELRQLLEKIELLGAQRDEAIAARKRADEEKADTEARLKMLQQDLHARELDVEFLSLSHKLAATPEALAEARVTVKGLLAKVEKAIRLLEEDAGI